MSIYEGKESYIFISYSHKDRKKVMPVIKRLQNDGFRLWYDEGIEAGSEWPETVAEHLMSCGLFLAFISGNYLDSFNCKREIDFAVSKRKSFIAVMLENAALSPGMEMQLASVQFLNKYQMKDEEFYAKLLQTELINPCRKEAEDDMADKEMKTGEISDGDRSKQKPERLHFFGKKHESIKTGRKRKLGAKKIAAIVTGTLAAAVLLFLLGWNLTHITIAGTRYRFNEEYLTIKDATLTPADTGRLSRFTNLGLLQFENCDFSGNSEDSLRRIGDSVRSFHLINCKGLENFGWLSGIKSVEWLEINNCGLDDDNVSDVWFLNMDRLVSLDLSNNKELTNLGGILNSVNSDLHQIHMANTGVYSLASLSKFEELEMIDISGCEVGSLEPLHNLSNVTYIAADHNKLESLDGIEGMTKLDTLSVSGNGLVSAEAVKDCVYLERVDLSDNKLTDISPLAASRVSLKKLFLDNNDIKDMTPLSGMSSLEVLSMDGNEVQDLAFLDESSELKILSARNNKIHSLGPILDKQGIDALYLSGNEITGDVVFGEKLGGWNSSISGGSGAHEIQLQHNHISSLEFRGSAPQSLAVYDNPLEKLNGSSEVPDEDEASEPVKGTATFRASNGHTLVVEDFVEPQERKGTLSGTYYAYLSWDTGSEEMLDMISCFDQYISLYLSGCPLDYQSQVEEKISSVYYTTNDNMDGILDEDRSKKIDLYDD